jgi:hypothetical protein
MTEYQTGINPLCSSFTYYLTKRDKRRNTAILATTTSLLGGPGAPRAQRRCYDRFFIFFYRGKPSPTLTHRVPEQTCATQAHTENVRFSPMAMFDTTRRNGRRHKKNDPSVKMGLTQKYILSISHAYSAINWNRFGQW